MSNALTGYMQNVIDDLKAQLAASEAARQQAEQVLLACAMAECSDPEYCVAARPETWCPRCRARIYLEERRVK